MAKRGRKHVDELRGASALALVATRGLTDLVEEMHRTIASGPRVLGSPLEGPARALTGLVYGHIHRVTRIVGVGIEAVLSRLAPLLGEGAPGPERDRVLGALNGVLGDYLLETENPLAIEMSFRSQDTTSTLDAGDLRAALPDAKAKLLVLVHGSSLSARQWRREGHDHGAELARELGYTAVYLNYNTGLHVSTNGRLLAERLDALKRAWPTTLSEISIVGHSMGGLVARSACDHAEREGLRWREQLERLVCLGSPHHGSALERGGNWIHALLGISEYSAPFTRLARIRSAGVTDLRFGYVFDSHWQGRNRFRPTADPRRDLSLPRGVDCYAIAGTTAKTWQETLPSDGLVAVDSALGRHERKDLDLSFPQENQFVALATSHLDLLSSPEVYARLRAWLGGRATGTRLPRKSLAPRIPQR
jgi:pimeloyl-ACP methyl ester carboxylesterase